MQIKNKKWVYSVVIMTKNNTGKSIQSSKFLIRRTLQSLIIGISLLAAGVMTATAVFADGNHGSVNAGGRFTPNINGAIFPPQPRFAENVRNFPQTQAATNQLREEGFASIAADPAVAGMLGDRYAFLGSAMQKDKWTGANQKQHWNFFSHSWNQTVTVTYQNGGIVDTQVTAASENQPALGETEKTEAIDIARDHWMGLGNTTVIGLTGYSIQTFQDDGAPFPTRMVYVSFHVESPEPPLLANWVDLTTQQVVRSELAR